jgi:hypothetical protein
MSSSPTYFSVNYSDKEMTCIDEKLINTGADDSLIETSMRE